MRKMWTPISDFKDWLKSVYFNFHYLPFHQAKLLPIRLHNTKFVNLKGKIRIEGKVTKGMIKLGTYLHGGYPDGGFMFENNGGEIVFRGRVTIGANSCFSIGEYGLLEISGPTVCVQGLKLICYHHIQIDEHCRIGWDVLMMDTGFHPLKYMDGSFTGKGVAPVKLGHHTWVSTRCMVSPGAQTAPYTIVAANSLLNKAFDESYVLLAGAPAKLRKRGVYRDMTDDRIDYSKYSLI